MKKQKPAADEAREILVMRDGREYPILERRGRYFVTERGQYGVSNSEIVEVKRRDVADIKKTSLTED